MKKLYYCDANFDTPVDLCHKDDLENERRKQLSIETNRRRREMAMKVKREIEKEERRRMEILKQRKDYQSNLNEKLHRRSVQRSGKTTSVQQLTSSDLDRTLTVLRGTMPSSSLRQRAQSSEDISRLNSRLESAWSDNREVCASPMIKYSGPEGINKHRDNDHYFKTFETKLIEQGEAFRLKQNIEMNRFSTMLNETIVHSEDLKRVEPVVDENATFRVEKDKHDNLVEDVIECVDDYDDDAMEDSLEIHLQSNNVRETKTFTGDDSKKVMINGPMRLETRPDINEIISTPIHYSELSTSPPVLHLNNDFVPHKPTKSSIPPSNPSQFDTSTTIKSILKKGLNNKFGSNPDLVVSDRSMDIRDSVEVTKTRSSRLFRSSSFSQSLNDINHDKTSVEEDGIKKFVRFADDSVANAGGLDSQVPKVSQIADPNKAVPLQKVQKTFTVPGSTPLKPPLHPRSTQEGSYLQGSLKRSPVYQPPPRPRKISVESLDKQLEQFIHPKKPAQTADVTSRETSAVKHDDSLWDIALDKTPTEKEIEQLWAEVRECLSKSRSTSKPESVGPISGRTIDSGSEVSVRSAPAWQRCTQRGVQFQVRHHRPWSSRQVPYQGQECPIRNEVTVHSHGDMSATSVTHQPLNVLDQRDQGFQAVSESMEEFLSLEGASNTPNYRRLNQTTPAATTPVFLPRPPSNIRMRTQPTRLYTTNGPLLPTERKKCSTEILGTPRTQLSLDEDKVKKSLDRLNDRLKNMSTFV